MKLWPYKARCRCEADRTAATAVQTVRVRGVVRRDRQVHHWRAKDNAHFWHWASQSSKLVHP